LRLVDKSGNNQGVIVSGGNLIAGPLNLGSVDSQGIISIDYVSAGISVGQSPAVDFINGMNLFDMVYTTSLSGFSKINRALIPSGILGVNS
jgi:hypothetical protein